MYKNYLRKVSFFFFLSLVLLAMIILASTFVTDRDAFSQTLSDIGAFGSFLSGVGTLFAVTTAFIGLNTWKNQFKYTRYVEIIWAARKALREYVEVESRWASYMQLGMIRANKDFDEVIKRRINTKNKLLNLLNEKELILKTSLSEIDLVLNPSFDIERDYLWTNELINFMNSKNRIIEKQRQPTTKLINEEQHSKSTSDFFKEERQKINEFYENLNVKLNEESRKYIEI